MASVEEQIRALQSQIDALRMQQRPRGIAAPLSTPMGGTVDYSAGFTLPRSAIEAMQSIGTDVVRGIVSDNQRAAQRQAPPASRAAPAKRGNGWADARPITPPPGLQYVDQQVDAQDARDNALRRRVSPST